MSSTDWNKLERYKSQQRAQDEQNLQSATQQAPMIRSFWSAARPVVLAEGMKADIAATQTVFYVQALREGPGKYGPCWHVELDLNGQRYLTFFAHNTQRDALMAAMLHAIPETGPIPATLREFEAELGTGYDLTEPPD
jgi:hypothetical protein